jgi:hypothetical protein
MSFKNSISGKPKIFGFKNGKKAQKYKDWYLLTVPLVVYLCFLEQEVNRFLHCRCPSKDDLNVVFSSPELVFTEQCRWTKKRRTQMMPGCRSSSATAWFRKPILSSSDIIHILTVEEPREQCTVVFALIITEPASECVSLRSSATTPPRPASKLQLFKSKQAWNFLKYFFAENESLWSQGPVTRYFWKS